MRKNNRLGFLFFLIFIILPGSRSLAEGSKEIYIGTHNVRLFSCNDVVGQCNNGGDRTRFMSFDGPEPGRLYFIQLNPSETVYMGFSGILDPTDNNAHIVFRIKDITGTIVYPETSLPTVGVGFIPSITAARTGPNQIYTTGGYDAINFHPANPGTYYIEFTRKNNASGTVNLGGIDMKLLDITVYDTIAGLVKTGRLYSKSWQYYESNAGCSAKTYVYSVDSITTSCEFNNMSGGIWVQFCNQWGCQNTGNFVVDRKSRTTQSLLPQFKIFLNPPDPIIFPPATTLGQIVPPQPYGVQNCTTGNIVYHVNVDKPGNVEIDMTFGAPYVTRILNQTVVLGENLIIWDGLDGTLPTGVPVPNNVIITFTVKYINGLTNLPFYDVEGNPNGFLIDIVSPPGATPLVYWDDTNISGGGSNFTGCLSPPGCHTWSSAGQGFGNLRTLNTWWYNVSATTVPINLPQWRKPQTLTLIQQPPQNFCAGTNGVFFSVSPELNTEEYHWSYTGTGATIIQINPTDAFITVNFASNATSGNIQVYGTNFNCSTFQGPTSSLAITINPAPLPSIAGPASVCVGSSGNSYTTQPGMTGYIWTVSPGGTITSGSGTDNIFVTWNSLGANVVTVTYVNVNGCSPSNPIIYPVTVYALPTPTISGLTSVCEGASGVVYSTEAGMSGYIWSVSSGAIITGGGNGNSTITLTWTTAGIHTVFVNYTDVNGCTANTAASWPVTVNQLPTVVFTYNTPNSCSGLPLNIQLSSNVSGATFTWTATGSAGVTPLTLSGTGNITDPFTNTGTAIENVVFSVVPSALGCSPVAPVLSNPVLIYPVPDLIISPTNLTVCSNTQANVTLSSIVQNTTYSWTATGGSGISPATVSGAGNIAETFQNSGTAPATVSFAIVPSANGCSNPGLPPYLLIVNPKPGVIFPANPVNPQTICSGTSSATVNLQSTVTLPGVAYAWTAAAFDPVNPTANITGFTSPNSGNSIPGENITSTLLGPGLIKYEVTATFTNGGISCPGDPSEYSVIVNPSPTVALSPADPTGQTICSGTSSQAITFVPNVAPTTYSWLAVEVVGVNTPVMNGTTDFIPGQVLTVTGAAQGHVKYKVTPTYLGSGTFTCPGGVSYSTIFVNPLPAPLITSTSPQTVCEYQSNVLYSTPNVVGNSYTWVVTGGSVFNANTNAVTVNWGSYMASPGTLTVTEKINATGCEQTSPVFSVILQQRPLPTLSGAQTVCDGAFGKLYQTEPLMSNYTWTISGGSITAGGTPMSNTATVTWNTPGSQWIQVNYINGLGCPGFPAKQIAVTVNPLPVSTISEGTGPACKLQSHVYHAPADPSCTFTWSIIPPADGLISSGQGTNSIIIDWQTSGAAIVAVTATNNTTNCFTSSTFPVLVNPSPEPTFSACFDIKTTPNARKFTLRGGTPYLLVQGVYSGNRVSYNAVSGMYEFDPYGASVGNYPIIYTFTNNFGCTVAASPVTITIVNSSFTCNGDLTDVRDGKKYKTSMIGGRCWMRENLAYGAVLDAAIAQTDNCISEKYCLSTDATCTIYGGLYQWDELMAYSTTSANQGLCPPEWHIPSEVEWQAMINAIVNGITPPVDGFCGSFLKDAFLNPGFHALLDGIYYLNNRWDFTTGSLTGTMYWTSTPDGADHSIARGVNLINPSISKYPGSRGNAFTVRCVKD